MIGGYISVFEMLPLADLSECFQGTVLCRLGGAKVHGSSPDLSVAFSFIITFGLLIQGL